MADLGKSWHGSDPPTPLSGNARILTAPVSSTPPLVTFASFEGGWFVKVCDRYPNCSVTIALLFFDLDKN